MTNGSDAFAPLRSVAAGRPVALAIGMFDGVHRGHVRVLEAARAAAEPMGGIASVLTFDPHPSAIVRPAQRTPLLQPAEVRLERLRELGFGTVVLQPFSPELAAIAAEDFLPWLRDRLPDLAAICVGENWRFGRGASGDAAALRTYAAPLGLVVEALPRLTAAGAPISSTRIRECVATGAVADAGGLLGYPYFALGGVEPGRQLARTLGFPTLNIAWQPEVRPAFGVYRAQVRRAGAPAPTARPAIANYGVKPTVATESRPWLEAHLLGGNPEAWGPGDTLRVELLDFLRPERRFDSIEALRAQIAADVAAVARLA